jgi:kynureninase
VTYGSRPADRFAGSTYDPVSHYRARAVIEFFDVLIEASVEQLRALSLRQTQRILDGLDGFLVRTPRDDARRGGFVAIQVPDATSIVRALRRRGIHTDARGDVLRLGPAPYVTDDELDAALDALRAIVRP